MERTSENLLPQPMDSDGKGGSLMIRVLLIAFAIYGLLAEVAMGANGNDMCRQLIEFSKNLKGSESREVVLFSEWSAEPAKACKHDRADDIASAFCAWLFDNTSTEFMEANVRSALSCLTGERTRTKTPGSVMSMTGTLRFSEVALRGVDNRIFEIEYSVRNKESPDMLRISVRPLNK